MPAFVDIAGQRFGRLIAVEVAFRGGPIKWKCRCDCGNESNVLGSSLRTGNTKSCGCLEAESRGVSRRTHGHSGTPLYDLWRTMKRRCDPALSEEYPNYSGRGITICERWRDSFTAFRDDMGPRPSPEHTVDRINNDGDYEPDNCQWATPKQQHRNTRLNRRLTHRGITKTVTEWAEDLGVKRAAIYSRLRKGWSVERTLSEPIHPRTQFHSAAPSAVAATPAAAGTITPDVVPASSPRAAGAIAAASHDAPRVETPAAAEV